MAYKPAKRNYRKKGVNRRRKPKMNLKRMVTNIVNKNRETKRLFVATDFSLPLSSGTKGSDEMISFEFPQSGQPAGLCANLTNIGDLPFERNGNEITPNYFCFKGLLSVLGNSTNANRDMMVVRIVAGFVDSLLTETTTTLQLSNGTTQSLSPDFKALYRKFNWQKFRPFYDRTFKLGCPHISATGDGGLSANSIAATSNAIPSARMVNIKHYFGKTAKNMNYSRTGDTIVANNRNIQVLAIVRNAHDTNFHSGGLIVNLNGEGHFSFKDC